MSVVESTPPEPQAKRKKIAIVGTAPQWEMAPFDNPEWEVWGLLGVSTTGRRLTRLYELHKEHLVRPLIEKPPHAGKYWEVARALGKNYITNAAFPEAPEATRYDFEARIRKYGPFFASTASWMIADAIEENPEEIAIYGINMAHETEYGYQKPSCTFLLGWAKAVGIKITLPSSSELLAVPYQYGYQDAPRAIACFAQRKAEYTNALNAHKQHLDHAQKNVYATEQCLDLLKWFEQNWHTASVATPEESNG